MHFLLAVYTTSLELEATSAMRKFTSAWRTASTNFKKSTTPGAWSKYKREEDDTASKYLKSSIILLYRPNHKSAKF